MSRYRLGAEELLELGNREKKPACGRPDCPDCAPRKPFLAGRPAAMGQEVMASPAPGEAVIATLALAVGILFIAYGG